VAEPLARHYLVDDEPVTRTALRRLLERAGLEARAEAADADTAIEVSVRERPRLCLVDLYLPRGGIRVVREVCGGAGGAGGGADGLL
jgi:DNA-binding NarL/FixJ family response regulator